jgi:branched-chain amino acid transport system permease protein
MATPSSSAAAVVHLARRHRWRPVEVLPWILAVAAFFLFPDYRVLGSQVLIMIGFALSLDLILGYAGIVSLGHAAFFGTGAYTAGLLVNAGWTEPISGLAIAALAAAAIGLISGWVILRTHGLTLLMLTLATTVILQEIANEKDEITGGSDGLLFTVDPLFGQFDFDLEGSVAYLYALVVVAILFYVTRRIVHSPFGFSLTGIRENTDRMHTVGTSVHRRLVTVYVISAAMAGVAGALLSQTTEIAALNSLSFERSGAVLIMLVLGGSGRLYGAFVGATVYMVLEDRLANIDPVYWLFWIGLVLVLVVLFARRGLFGVLSDAAAKAGWRA